MPMNLVVMIGRSALVRATRNNRSRGRGSSQHRRIFESGLEVFCDSWHGKPYSQFVPWVVTQHGVPMGLFLRELFANRIGGFFGMDALGSAVVLIFFLRREGKRLGVRHLWLPVAATLTVGVSLGLPLFLYLREDTLEKPNAAK